MNREEQIIEFETQRNDAMDRYFNARPQLLRTDEQEKLFEAGFRMAWEILHDLIEAEYEARVVEAVESLNIRDILSMNGEHIPLIGKNDATEAIKALRGER